MPLASMMYPGNDIALCQKSTKTLSRKVQSSGLPPNQQLSATGTDKTSPVERPSKTTIRKSEFDYFSPDRSTVLLPATMSERGISAEDDSRSRKRPSSEMITEASPSTAAEHQVHHGFHIHVQRVINRLTKDRWVDSVEREQGIFRFDDIYYW